jgi:hypothetical protein
VLDGAVAGMRSEGVGGIFVEQIASFSGNDRVEEKKRLMREWRANCWKRHNPQMDAAQKRLADLTKEFYYLENLREGWVSSISQIFGGVEKTNSMSLSNLRNWIEQGYDEVRLRIKKEIDDTEFRGSDLGRFDQFWDNCDIFECCTLGRNGSISLNIQLHHLISMRKL